MFRGDVVGRRLCVIVIFVIVLLMLLSNTLHMLRIEIHVVVRIFLLHGLMPDMQSNSVHKKINFFITNKNNEETYHDTLLH